MKKRYELPDGSWGNREKAAKVYIDQGCIDHPGHRVTIHCPCIVLYRGIQRSFRNDGDSSFQDSFDASWPPSDTRNKAFLLEHGSSLKNGQRIKTGDPLYCRFRHYVTASSHIYDAEWCQQYNAAYPPPLAHSGNLGKRHGNKRLYSVYLIDGKDFMYSLGPNIFYYCDGELTAISLEDRAYLLHYHADTMVKISFSGPHYLSDTRWVDAALAKRNHNNSNGLDLIDP